MDFSGGSLDRFTAQLAPAIQTLLAGVKEDEAAAIAAFHVSIQEVIAGEQAVVAHLFAELDQRIAKFAAALSAAFPVNP